MHLLQILSIRYTGVRQQEDDLVTLLRKAGFEHIKLAAIEGFIPEEEQAEAALAGGPRDERRAATIRPISGTCRCRR